MPFKKILVALDGSKYSQMAADYGFWLASSLDAKLTGQHVIDPRVADLFIAEEFAQELGFSISVDAQAKVMNALRRIGKVVLDLFATQAVGKGLKVDTVLDEGYITQQIVQYAENFDLLIVGRRGRGEAKMPTELLVGSVAERVALASQKPVLIACHPVTSVRQILVAYDGSEPARGALLLAERMAKFTDCQLKAITVVANPANVKESHMLIEQGESFLREAWAENVFVTDHGDTGETLLKHASESRSLLVLGAYGFRSPEQNVLGSTTSKIIRHTSTSILVFKDGMSLEQARPYAEATQIS